MKKNALRLLAVAFTAALCLGIAACSPAANSSSSSDSSSSSSSSASDGATITVDGQEYTATSPYVSDEVCLSCHGGSYDAVAQLTADYGEQNPHDSIHGGYSHCNNCHENGSEITDNMCDNCHEWPRDNIGLVSAE